MKHSIATILILLTIISSKTIANDNQDFLNTIEQDLKTQFVEDGSEHVYSKSKRMSKLDLDRYFSRSHLFESNVNEFEAKRIYNCAKSDHCNLFHISISSEYWGGYGEDAYFVLINEYKDYQVFHHIIYTE